MPLQIAEVDRRILEHSPLTNVICQIRFGDDETRVLEAHRHAAYRNLAPPTKEAPSR